MGVNGLVPFLTKKCPEVFKELQGGLKALSGKTVIFDGTLLTQRFHFAQSPLKRRVIVGWYRMVNDMRLHGVKPICVFDGKERTAAKKREVLKRRADRVLAAMRGDLEGQRLERLFKMHDTIRALKGLSDEEKKRATRKLRSIMDTSTAKAIGSTEPQIEVEVQDDPADIIDLLLSPEEPESTARPTEQPTEQGSGPEESEKASAPVPLSHTSLPTPGPPLDGTETKAHVATSEVEQLQTQTQALPPASGDSDRLSVSPKVTPLVQEEPTSHPKEFSPEKEEESLEAIADALTKLYKEYQDSVSAFNGALTSSESSSAAAGDVPIFLSATPGPSVDSPNDKTRADGSCKSIPGEDEPSVILRASKYQVELMDMESEAWSLLSSVASSSSPALRNDDTAPANMLSHPPDQPPNGIPVDQSAASVEAVGTTLGPVVEMDSIQHDVSQPPQTAGPSTPAQFVKQAEETFHNVEQRSEAMAASYKRRIDAPTDRTYREARSLLQAMGVPVVVTEGGEEAEAVASALVLEGNGDFVATEDTDVLIHGATMLRNITSHRMKESTLVTISGLEVRRALEIPTHKAYIDFALLLGTDFTERIKNLGPEAAHKLIKEYGSIENVIKLIQGEDVQPTTIITTTTSSKKAQIIAVGGEQEEEEKTNEGKKPKKKPKPKPRKSNRAKSSRYTIRYPLSEYLTHVHMGREVYSTHPPTPPKRLLAQKPRDDEALLALLREWKMDLGQLDGPEELLGGQVWTLGEGDAWVSGEDGDIFRKFGGSLDWEEPWEDDPSS